MYVINIVGEGVKYYYSDLVPKGGHTNMVINGSKMDQLVLKMDLLPINYRRVKPVL